MVWRTPLTLKRRFTLLLTLLFIVLGVAVVYDQYQGIATANQLQRQARLTTWLHDLSMFRQDVRELSLHLANTNLAQASRTRQHLQGHLETIAGSEANSENRLAAQESTTVAVRSLFSKDFGALSYTQKQQRLKTLLSDISRDYTAAQAELDRLSTQLVRHSYGSAQARMIIQVILAIDAILILMFFLNAIRRPLQEMNHTLRRWKVGMESDMELAEHQDEIGLLARAAQALQQDRTHALRKLADVENNHTLETANRLRQLQETVRAPIQNLEQQMQGLITTADQVRKNVADADRHTNTLLTQTTEGSEEMLALLQEFQTVTRNLEPLQQDLTQLFSATQEPLEKWHELQDNFSDLQDTSARLDETHAQMQATMEACHLLALNADLLASNGQATPPAMQAACNQALANDSRQLATALPHLAQRQQTLQQQAAALVPQFFESLQAFQSSWQTISQVTMGLQQGYQQEQQPLLDNLKRQLTRVATAAGQLKGQTVLWRESWKNHSSQAAQNVQLMEQINTQTKALQQNVDKMLTAFG